MKHVFVFSVGVILYSLAFKANAQSGGSQNPSAVSKKPNSLFMDVHHLGAGKVTAKDLAGAHQKDLAVEKKYGVNIINYFFDEANGDVYCLASGPTANDLRKTHAEAHGLVPDQIFEVKEGEKSNKKGNNSFYLDFHQLTPGKVTAKDVAEAHRKDLLVQKKYGVNLVNYWFDENTGTVMCLAQAPDSAALANTHKEAHGLLPDRVVKVSQNQ
jgi:hypothetical protein